MAIWTLPQKLEDLKHRASPGLKIMARFEAWRTIIRYSPGPNWWRDILIDRITAAGGWGFEKPFSDSARWLQTWRWHLHCKTVEEIPVSVFSATLLKPMAFGLKNPASICSVLTPCRCLSACEGYGKIIGIDRTWWYPTRHYLFMKMAIFCWKVKKKWWSGKKADL